MEEDDYVETSDIEELAELESRADIARSSPRRPSSPIPDEELPRKKPKLFHDFAKDSSMAELPVEKEALKPPRVPTPDTVNLSESTICVTHTSESLRPQFLKQPDTALMGPREKLVTAATSLSQEDDPLRSQSPALHIHDEEDMADQNEPSDGEDDEESQMPFEGSPLPEAQIPPELFEDEDIPIHLDTRNPPTSDTEGHLTEGPLSTPPVTPHSPRQPPWHSPTSSPDPLVLTDKRSLSRSPAFENSADRKDENTDTEMQQPSSQLTRSQNADGREGQRDDLDELLLFSPPKPTHRDDSKNLSSPLTVISSTPAQHMSKRKPPSTASSQHIPNSPSNLDLPAMVILDEVEVMQNEGREEDGNARGKYQLRKRQAAQKHPFKFDQMRYAAQMKSNPDAFVGSKDLRRQLKEAQMREGDRDGYEDEDIDGLIKRAERERERRNEKRKEKEPAKEDLSHYPAILQEEYTTDEEEKEMDMEARKGRRFLKAKEKERKKRELEEQKKKRQQEAEEGEKRREDKGKERAHRVNPHPLEKPQSKRHRPRRPSTDLPLAEPLIDNSPPSRSTSPPVPSSKSANKNNGRTASMDVDVVRDYFTHDDFDLSAPNDDWDLPRYDVDEPGPSNYATRSRSSRSPRATSPTLPPASSNDAVKADKDVIELSDDDHDEEDPNRNPDDGDDPERNLALDKKQKRALGRMFPRSMITTFAKGRGKTQTSKQDRRSSSPVIVSSDEGRGPIRPGQTKVRQSNGGLREVKGDTESSASSTTSEEESSSESGSDALEVIQSYRRRALPRREPHRVAHEPEVLVITSSDSDDDDDIRLFIEDVQPRRRRKANGDVTKLRDKPLIDYMIPRVDGRKNTSRKGAPGTHQSRSFSNKLNITTREGRGHGRERQTLLSFHRHTGSQHRRSESRRDSSPMRTGDGTHPRKPRARSASKSSEATLFDRPLYRLGDLDDTEPQDHPIVHAVQDPKNRSWKEKQKRKKKRAQRNGVYNFAPSSRADVDVDEGGGRRRRRDDGFMVVDLGDQEFHHLLAGTGGPIVNIGAIRYEPPSANSGRQDHEFKRVKSRASISDGISKAETWLENQQTSGIPRPVVKLPTEKVLFDYELGVKPPAGRTFSMTSYIRKGWLHELISPPIPPAENELPLLSTTFCRLEFSAGMGVDQLCQAIPRLLESLHDASTDLLEPELGSLSEEWKPGLRITSQIVSRHLHQADEHNQSRLRSAIEKEVGQTLTELEKHTTKLIEKPVLSLSWFLVELSLRSLKSLQAAVPSATGLLHRTCKMLMSFLLRVGVHDVAELLKSDEDIDESSPSSFHYAAELWVCLIHVLTWVAESERSSKGHPFWTLLLQTLQSEPPNDSESRFDASESSWLIIFSFCALSQFSSAGIPTALPRLPAAWEVVGHAIKKISLGESPEQHHLKNETLQARDRYIRILVLRCTHLRDTWRWRLDDGSPMFTKLSEFFRTRSFSNLRHEVNKGVYFLPKFLKKADWRLLNVHDPTDTAFAMFIKLIYHACRDEMEHGKKSRAKVKKLLSLAMPLGVLSATPQRQPDARERTSFVNCLAAIAVTIVVDPLDREDRTNRAKTYLPFPTADFQSRHRVIWGIERLAILMIKRDFDLGGIVDWLEDVCRTLEEEAKYINLKEVSFATLRPQPLVRLTYHLLNCGTEIMQSFRTQGRYPDPQVIGKLKPFLDSPLFKHEALRPPLAIFLTALFDARAASLPQPRRPTPVTLQEPEEESQDYFAGFEAIDVSALEDSHLEGQKSSQDIALEQDATLRQILAPNQMRYMWQLYPHVREYIQSPPPADTSISGYRNDCDRWIRIWLCFGDVARPAENKWGPHISLLLNLLESSKDDRWSLRIRLSIFFQLLQIDPMVYKEHKDDALEVFFEALVSDSAALESQYVSLLLSIDWLRHPVFSGATECLPAREGDYQFSAEQFRTLRLPLMRVIFVNVERLLADGSPHSTTTTSDKEKSDATRCQSMFSCIRRLRTALVNQSGEDSDRVRAYSRFCVDVFDALQGFPRLRTYLDFFVGWSRTIRIPE